MKKQNEKALKDTLFTTLNEKELMSVSGGAKRITKEDFRTCKPIDLTGLTTALAKEEFFIVKVDKTPH